MGIKDLFEKPQQILTSENAEGLTKDKAESEEYLEAALRAKEEFVPYVDFSSASNFAFYGSAEQYYDQAIKTIYREYPYDGSEHEQKEYSLKLNYLTRHVFEKEYPRTNGYVTLGKSQSYNSLWGHYGGPSALEYIEVFGGPQTGSHIQHDILDADGQPLHKIFEHANKLESDPYSLYGKSKGDNAGQRLSNLRLSPADGITVEFWLKKTAFNSANTKKEVILDLWNGKPTTDSSYGRLLIELSSSATNPFRVSLLSGSVTTLSDLPVAPLGWSTTNITNGWNHYAISITGSAVGKPANTAIKFYYNGDLLRTTNEASAVYEVTGGLRANIGALGGASGANKGFGLLSGSLDEFRYWTTNRNSEQIGRNWFTQVRGGTNDEPYNTGLGVYFKFNEGFSGNDETDIRVLDYSGRISNGTWVGYPGKAHSSRRTASAMVEAGVTSSEYKDPIIYKTHPQVQTLVTNLRATGSVWDDTNNAALINSIPEFIREEDTINGDSSLTNIVQLMGSYFDKMQHLIDALPKVRAASYMTASAKPYPFATHLLDSVGMDVPQLFVQADVLESLAARDEDRNYERDITETKNLIYQNIYNNLVYIYKSKGTEKSIRNLIRCFGVDEELVRLNLYSSNTTYELKQNTRTKAVKRKFINFNDVDKFAANVYQYADPSNSNTAGYIAGSGPTTATSSLGHEELLGMTTEAEFIFPLKLGKRELGYFDTPFLTASLFGMHSADPSSPNSLTVPAQDYANFQVVAIRPSIESKHVHFKLTSSASPRHTIPELTSSLFLDTYENKRWNISVRLRPSLPVTDFTTGSNISSTYDVHFYGVNMEGGITANSFHVSGTIEGHVARNFLRSNKRMYVGAHRTNFTGGTLIQTDVAAGGLRYWTTFLEKQDLDSHARDPENYGITDPYKSLNLYAQEIGGIRVPKIDALALNWTFDNVTGPSSDPSDPSVKDSYFYVADYSSGSAEIVNNDRYGWMTPIIMKQHSGKGDSFLPPESGDRNPVIVEYISAARQQQPEVLNTADAVQILRQDDDKFTREHSIIEHFYALEKSMYQTISEEMINMFASVVDFNNLIGNPVNRYRQEYKDLSKLRQLFYERIGNTPDLDRYIEFYKWIDSAVTTAIEQLIPASAEVSDELHNMVESHVLERNKYWTKFPTIEFKQGDPTAGLRGVHELTYDWKHGHAPISGKESSNALYWNDRAIRTDEQLKTGQSGVDSNKESLRGKINQHRDDSGTALAKPDGITYTGRTYALKRFTKPYRFEMDRSKEYRSGINFNENKKVDIAQAALEPHMPLTISSSVEPLHRPDIPGLPTNVLFVDGANLESFKDVQDNIELKTKRIHKGTVILGRAKEFDQLNNETYSVSTLAKALPAQVVSSSVVSGFNKVWQGVNSAGFVTGTTITNIHNDVYGQDREIPIQGPFTEKYVGGHSSRHIRLNPGTDSFKNRPEAWRILVGKMSAGMVTHDPGAFGFVGQDYPYPNMGQDPVASTGRIDFLLGADGVPNDGDFITIGDGDTTIHFDFDKNGEYASVLNRKRVDISSASSGADTAQALVDAINSVSNLQISAVRDGARVTLTNTLYGTPTSLGNKIYGSRGNVPMTEYAFIPARSNLKGVRFEGDSSSRFGLNNYNVTTDAYSDPSFTMNMWVSCSAATFDGNGEKHFWSVGRYAGPGTLRRLYFNNSAAGKPLRLRFSQEHDTGALHWHSNLPLTDNTYQVNGLGGNTGGWYNITITYASPNNGTATLPVVYINGVSASTDTVATTSDVSRRTLGNPKDTAVFTSIAGQEHNNGSGWLTGKSLRQSVVAELSYWDEPLNSTKVAALSRTTSTPNPLIQTGASSGVLRGPVTPAELPASDRPDYHWTFGDTTNDALENSGGTHGIRESRTLAASKSWWRGVSGGTPNSVFSIIEFTGSHQSRSTDAEIAGGGTWTFTTSVDGLPSHGTIIATSWNRGMHAGKDPIILDYHAPKATRYREELVKRPVNIKNILQTSSSVDVSLSGSRTHGPIGNYSNNYEIVLTSPRSVNDLYFRNDHLKCNAHPELDLINPRGLLRKHGTATGIGEWTKELSGYSDKFELPNRNQTSGNSNKTVIVTRFSAPGGFESISRGFLDPAHEEYSPNDVVAFRNRRVRGLGQWAATSGSIPNNVSFASQTYNTSDSDKSNYRVYDIHGEPWGLRTHLARWTNRFGRDSAKTPNLIGSLSPGSASFEYDGIGWTADQELPGFHKVHRNRTVVRDYITRPVTNTATITNGIAAPKGIWLRKNGTTGAGTVRVNNARFHTYLTHARHQDIGNTFTIAQWIHLGPNAMPTNLKGIFGIGMTNLNSVSHPTFKVGITSGGTGNKIELQVRDISSPNMLRRYVTTQGLTANLTALIVVVYDGSAPNKFPRVYVNGVKWTVGEDLSIGNYDGSAVAEVLQGKYMTVGAGWESGVGHQTMEDTKFNEFVLWPSALGESSIKQLSCVGPSAFTAPTSHNHMVDITKKKGGHPLVNGGQLNDEIVNTHLLWYRFGELDHLGNPENNSELQQLGVVFAPDPSSLANDKLEVLGTAQYVVTNPQMTYDTVQSPLVATFDSVVSIEDNYSFYNRHKFDNFNVQHAIPRNHGNYSWIQKSVIKPHIPIGLPTASDALQFITASDFGSIMYRGTGASHQPLRVWGTSEQRASGLIGKHVRLHPGWQPTDFVGLNTHIYEPLNSKTNVLGKPPSLPYIGTGLLGPHQRDGANGPDHGDNVMLVNNTFVQYTMPFQIDPNNHIVQVFNALILKRQGPYGWPTWKQIRGRNHPIIRHQLKNAEMSYILPDAPELHLSTSMGHSVLRPRHGKIHHHARISPVTSKYLPLRTTVGVSTQITNKFGKRHTVQLPIDIQTPYGNELSYFNKEQINKDLGLSRNKVAAYEEIKGMYTRGALETSLSPVTDIKKFEYSEIVWPRHENMYSKEVRGKEGYGNNFWLGTHTERTLARPNTIHGTSSYGRNLAFSDYVVAIGNAAHPADASIWPLDEQTGSFLVYPSYSTRGKSAKRAIYAGASWENLLAVGNGEGELLNSWSYPVKWATGRFDRDDTDNSTDPVQDRNRLEAGPLLALPHMCHATSSIASPTQAPLATCGTSSTGQNPRGIRATKDQAARYTYGQLYNTAEWVGGTHTWPIMPLNDNANWLGFVPSLQTTVSWQTGQLAGKTKEINQINSKKSTAKAAGVQTTKFVSAPSAPWTQDYDTFKHEVRVKAKDYSVIPEFRMEDHIEDYVKQKGSDFLAEQNSLFRMVGMPSGSVLGSANSAEENFYTIYGTSDFMKHFDVLRHDIDEHYKPSTLTLQCSAYLKFNPYEGFYPANRTLQLAQKLSASYGDHIKYTGPAMPTPSSRPGGRDLVNGQPPGGEMDGSSTNLAFRNFITPLYAPGIMYNTIKAGIACDWPVMTTGSKIYKTRAGKSDYWGLGYPNPERDQALHTYLETTYNGVQQASQATWKTMEIEDPFTQGFYAIRETYRQEAIKAALIPVSASISGLSNGLELQGVVSPSDGTYGAGFYTTKVNIHDLPGLQQASGSLQLHTDIDLGTGNTGAIVRVDITVTHKPPENQGRWDKRIPFEAIINPAKYMANEPLFDYTAHPSSSNAATASWDGQGDGIYSMMTNNFLASVPDFFLKSGNFTSIASRPQDELSLYAQAGEVYGMRIKMYRSLNRDRTYSNERCAPLRSASYEVPQDPRDDHGLHETFTMYSRASAFGYPVFGRVHSIRDLPGIAWTGKQNNVSSSGGTTVYTASLAVASDLVYKYQDLIRASVFAKTNQGSNTYETSRGREYEMFGQQRLNSTIFHTSSFKATKNGVLDSLEGYYWSYTPPYMHGEAWCDLVFKPSASKVYSISEILDSLTVVQRRVDPGYRYPDKSTGEKEPQFIGEGYHSQSLYSAENINANAMQLDSSLNLFGIGKAKTYAYSDVGQTGQIKTRTRKRTVGDSPAWIIQPKFETPMLNFSPLSREKGGTSPRPLTDDLLKLPVWGSGSVSRGIWHQFGTLPQGSEGVWLKVGDIPKTWLDNHPEVSETDTYAGSNASGSYALHKYRRKVLGNTMKSLTDFVGMSPEPRRLGEIRDQITVSEAVVAIPFIEKNNRRWFFQIDPHMVDVALGEEQYRMSDNSDSPGDSIQEMIRKMDKYVFPPTFDFIRNRDLDALAMYIFEFNMTFDKDDLSYIWQNLMPPSASGFSTSSSSITHDLLANELMGFAGKTTGKPIQDKVQWLVFKVKQRAATNYFEKVILESPELDKLSSMARSNQVTLGKNEEATYNYNWPYDHFSIVEMARIKASVEFAELPTSTAEAVKVDGTGGRPTKKGVYSTPGIPGHGVRSPVNPGFGSAPGKAADASGPSLSLSRELMPGGLSIDLGGPAGSLLGTPDGPSAGNYSMEAPATANNIVSAYGGLQSNDPYDLGGLQDIDIYTYQSPLDVGLVGSTDLGGSGPGGYNTDLGPGGIVGTLGGPGTTGIEAPTALGGDAGVLETDAGEAMGAGFSWLGGGLFF